MGVAGPDAGALVGSHCPPPALCWVPFRLGPDPPCSVALL